MTRAQASVSRFSALVRNERYAWHFFWRALAGLLLDSVETYEMAYASRTVHQTHRFAHE
jgi:hypothetical protein